MKRFLLIAIAIASTPLPGHAQLEQMRAGPEAGIGLELAKGFFDADGIEFYTSTLRARGLFPVGESGALFVDWGLSIAGFEGVGTDGTFANPEVGLARVDEDGRGSVFVSVSLPLAFGFGDDDVSVGSGLLTDFFRPDRWMDELMSVNVGFAPSTAIGDATELTADIVGAAMIPTGDANGDTEVLARYGLGVRHDAGAVALRGAIEGFAILSEGDLSLGERTIHRVLIAVEGTEGGPGFFVRIPMDDALEGIDAVFGVTFAF